MLQRERGRKNGELDMAGFSNFFFCLFSSMQARQLARARNVEWVGARRTNGRPAHPVGFSVGGSAVVSYVALSRSLGTLSLAASRHLGQRVISRPAAAAAAAAGFFRHHRKGETGPVDDGRHRLHADSLVGLVNGWAGAPALAPVPARRSS